MQMDVVTKAFSKRTPSAARRSSRGVFTTGLPAAPIASQRTSSITRSSTFRGGAGEAGCRPHPAIDASITIAGASRHHAYRLECILTSESARCAPTPRPLFRQRSSLVRERTGAGQVAAAGEGHGPAALVPTLDCGHGCYRTRASACRSRTVPPITSAAEMMSRFLMMYCPSIVGA